MPPVDLCVVSELGHPTLGRAVGRPGVHEAVVDGHRHNGAAVRVDILHNSGVGFLLQFVSTKEQKR